MDDSDTVANPKEALEIDENARSPFPHPPRSSWNRRLMSQPVELEKMEEPRHVGKDAHRFGFARGIAMGRGSGWTRNSNFRATARVGTTRKGRQVSGGQCLRQVEALHPLDQAAKCEKLVVVKIGKETRGAAERDPWPCPIDQLLRQENRERWGCFARRCGQELPQSFENGVRLRRVARVLGERPSQRRSGPGEAVRQRVRKSLGAPAFGFHRMLERHPQRRGRAPE